MSHPSRGSDRRPGADRSGAGVPRLGECRDTACDGRPATIVGTPGGTVIETFHDDVVVTNGAIDVHGSKGNDLVCVTGDAASVELEAADGSLDVDATATTSPVATDYIGRGGEFEYRGSQGPDDVRVDADTVTSHISTGPGDDTVLLEEPVATEIDLGSGDDTVEEFSGYGLASQPATSLTGGSGTNTLELDYVDDPPPDDTPTDDQPAWTIDNVRGLASRDGIQQLSWTGFDDFRLAIASSQLTLIGGPEPERFQVSGLRTNSVSDLTYAVVANLGAGDDVLRVNAIRTRARGGPGRDRFVLGLHDLRYKVSSRTRSQLSPVEVNLATGRVSYSPRVTPGSVHGFEDAYVRAGTAGGHIPPDVILVGADGPNALRVEGGCRDEVDGRGGADHIVLAGSAATGDSQPGEPCAAPTTARGGRGDDVLTGGPRPDLVLGGPGDDLMFGYAGDDTLTGGDGTDTADGGAGIDSCDAETVRNCP